MVAGANLTRLDGPCRGGVYPLPSPQREVTVKHTLSVLITTCTTWLLAACGNTDRVADDSPDAAAAATVESPPASPSHEHHATLATARSLADGDPVLTQALQPTTGGFVEDGAWLSSTGWRAATQGTVAARLQPLASQPFYVGAGLLAEHRFEMAALGARASRADLDGGRVVYQDAFPSTDVVVVATSTEVEVLFVLREPAAPTEFSWTVEHPAGTPRAHQEPGGALLLRSLDGNVSLRARPAYALDASGTRRDAELAFADGRLSVSLDATGLTYPVLLDPVLEVATWEDLTPGSGNPTSRSTHGLAYDSIRKRTVLFGGLVSGSPNNETWTWNGSAWSLACGTAPASECAISDRRNLQMAFDPMNGVALVFGGRVGGLTRLGDTWSWNGTAWSEICNGTTCSPEDRYEGALSYAGGGKVILFGGNAASDQTLGDTWEWAGGSNWTLKCANDACGPGGRQSAAMAYDSVRGVVVLFGGAGDSGALQDTWEWNGSAWTQRCTGACTKPSARSQHGMAFDSNRDRVVLFGGTGADENDETWEWDGSSWTQFTPSTRPTPRRTPLAYDSDRKRTVLFSGNDGATPLGGTWEYSTAGGACSVAADCNTTFCNDGVCCLTACNQPCQRCDGSTPGTCESVTNADDPDDCPAATSTCDGSGQCKLKDGQGCTGDSQCASGNCRDGRCCANGCTASCRSCDNASGTCTTVISNAEDPGTCEGTMSCDGSGVCKKKDGQTCGAGSECVSGNCVDGRCCVDGCTTPCRSCNNASGTCTTLVTSSDDDNCNGTMSCDASGACITKKMNGAGCAVADECQSGFCVDQVCCDSACGATCMACSNAAKGAGADGVCDNVLDGLDPRNDCPIPPGEPTCGLDGFCGGSGSCRQAPSSTPCGMTVCTGNNVSGSLCDGSGNCAASTGTPCDPYRCVDSGGTGACTTSCTSDADCAASGFCTGDSTTPGICAAKLAIGTSCGAGSECLSGNCADGVCCDTPCAGACDSCDTTAGSCTLISAGSTGDPDCAPFVCNGLSEACPTSCTNDSGCTPTAFCNASGECVGRTANGEACTRDDECTSGFCVDSVCCESACAGQCEACDDTPGTCTAVTGAPHGSRAACIDNGDECAGSCDGSDRTGCSYPAAGTDCGTPTCESDEERSFQCSGTGVCEPRTTLPCDPYRCGATACLDECSGDTDCTSGNSCIGGECQPTGAGQCDDEFTVIDQMGVTTDCSPYKCVAGGCESSCSTTDDCASSYTCDTDSQKCIRVSKGSGEDDGGCGCRTAGRRSSGLGWLAVIAFAAALARRRRARLLPQS